MYVLKYLIVTPKVAISVHTDRHNKIIFVAPFAKWAERQYIPLSTLLDWLRRKHGDAHLHHLSQGEEQ